MAGSPPHGRGKGIGRVDCGQVGGITPAWAGKSPAGSLYAVPSRDHPRMGGEKLKRPARRPARWGSPPHGRGKGAQSRPGQPLPRITPAWAGKSQRRLSPLQTQRDHPRMGGEKNFKSWICANYKGSPPHGRGKAQSGRTGAADRGITPAWAGKSCCTCSA